MAEKHPNLGNWVYNYLIKIGLLWSRLPWAKRPIWDGLVLWSFGNTASNYLRRSHMTQYRCGYCKLKNHWEYFEVCSSYVMTGVPYTLYNKKLKKTMSGKHKVCCWFPQKCIVGWKSSQNLDFSYTSIKSVLFSFPQFIILETNNIYTAIFLINGLCIVYCSLLQCLTLVYLGWGQKSEFFCLLVTTRRLQSGTVVGYRSTTTAYCRYMAAKGHWSTQGKGQSKVPCHCLPGGHIQGHWGVFTVVPGSKGLRVVPHLPCTRQPVSFRST